MAHTIVTDVCEGVADCVDACPVACIHEGPGKNMKGTDWYWIDFNICIDCGICLQVCPVEEAIVPEENPDLQKDPNLKDVLLITVINLKGCIGKICCVDQQPGLRCRRMQFLPKLRSLTQWEHR